MVVQDVAQRPAEPQAEGDAEPHLGALLYLRWNQIVERLAQDDLRAAARKLHRIGQLRDVLHERGVEEWRTRLERVRHRAAVRLDQQIIQQVRVEIDGKDLTERRQPP